MSRIITGTPGVGRLPASGAIRMPLPPLRTRAAFGSRSPSRCARSEPCSAGCELFEPGPPAGTGRPLRPTRRRLLLAPAPTLPGKHATRRGYYVFYHDFELDKNDPLFEPLEDVARPGLRRATSCRRRTPSFRSSCSTPRSATSATCSARRQGRYRHLPSRRAYFIAEPRIGGWGGRPEGLHVDGRPPPHRPAPRTHARPAPQRPQERAAVARRGARRLLRVAAGPRGREPAAPRRAAPRAVPARPRAAGEARAGEADGEAGVPRGVGVGPPHAPRRPAARKVLLDYLQTLRSSSTPGSAAAATPRGDPDPNRPSPHIWQQIEFPRSRSR